MTILKIDFFKPVDYTNLDCNGFQSTIEIVTKCFFQKVHSFDCDLARAIKEVREGKSPYQFVEMLRPENQTLMHSLSLEGVASVYAKPEFHACFSENCKTVDIQEEQKVEQAYQVMTWLIKRLALQNFTAKFVIRNVGVLNSTRDWHVDKVWDACGIPTSLRANFVIQGATTQFFVPTQEERESFINNKMSYESVIQQVTDTTNRDPNRVKMGSPYAVCIFGLSTTIHRAPTPTNQTDVRRRTLLIMDSKP